MRGRSYYKLKPRDTSHLVNVEMPINKFGLSLERSGAEPYYQWNGLLRNYVRDNALCVVTADFDARLRKIRCVALPVDDDDVANKQYVQQNIQILNDRQEEFEKKMIEFQNNVQTALHKLEVITSFSDKIE